MSLLPLIGRRAFGNLATLSVLLALPLQPCAAANFTAPDAEEHSESTAPEGPASTDVLEKQDRIRERYARLEALLLKLAEFEATENPTRADLLKQAYQQSRERLTHDQLRTLVKLLDESQLRRAIDSQRSVSTDLADLLQLLQDENRLDRGRRIQTRVREYIREIERLRALEQQLADGTVNGEELKQVARAQAEASKRVKELAEQIAKDEDIGGEPDTSEATPSEQTPDSPPAENPSAENPESSEPSDSGMPAENMPSDPSDSEPSDSSEPSDGSPMSDPGQPAAGSQNTPPKPQSETEDPIRKRIQAAQEKMQQAQRQLEEARRNEAAKEMQEAEQALARAQNELEKLLRQLREEEIQRVLAGLETRFTKMLEMQLAVYEDTLKLDKVAAKDRKRPFDIQAAIVGRDQKLIVLEAESALTLLEEEGSSIAFPEVVRQLRDDMSQTADRLARSRVGKITQSIEQDIISSLEDMLAALEKMQEDPPAASPPGDAAPPNGDLPLVDEIAELRMIKSMQLGVNARTIRYSRLLEDAQDTVGQADDADLIDALERLGEREVQIKKITREVVFGKNE